LHEGATVLGTVTGINGGYNYGLVVSVGFTVVAIGKVSGQTDCERSDLGAVDTRTVFTLEARSISVSVFALHVLHGEDLLSACGVSGRYHSVASAKFALGLWEEQSHVLEGATAYEDSSLSSGRARLWFDGVDLNIKLIVAIFLL
jgi:hypothetical protein